MIDTVFAGYTKQTFNIEPRGHVALHMEGPECPSVPVMNRSVMIDFTCDKKHGLGAPVKSLTLPCHTYFNWPSIALCPDSNKDRIMSKCYIFDNEGHQRDLSPLMSDEGHEVIDPKDVNKRIFINICSEVPKNCDNGKSNNDHGTAACAKTDKDVEHLGHIRKSSIRYDFDADEVIISYREMVKIPKCKDSGFTTNVRMKCPEKLPKYDNLERTPRFKGMTDCEMDIEWITDYACPAARLEGVMSNCSFLSKEGDVHFDLSSIQKKGTFELEVHGDNLTGIHNTPNHTLVFNVCSGLSRDSMAKCGASEWYSNSACLSDGTTKSVIGSMKDAKLLYSDGQLYLLYKGAKQDSGIYCPEEHVSPTTTINFICDPESDPGEASFVSFQDCNFLIEFRTKHACPPAIKYAVDCVWNNGSHTVDLSPLSLSWSNHFGYKMNTEQTNDTKLYFLNVCRPLNRVTSFGGWCHPNAAICEVTTNGSFSSFVSMGIPGKPTKYFDHHIVIVYEDGDMCNPAENKRWSSMIKFICDRHEGHGAPRISVESSTQECYHIFDWKTTLVCDLEADEHSKIQTTLASMVTSAMPSKAPSNPTTIKPSAASVPTANHKPATNESGIISPPASEKSPSIKTDSDDDSSTLGLVVIVMIALLATSLALFIILNSERRYVLRE